MLLGWRPNDKPLSFPDEYGSHAGPGYHETHGFALLPADAPIAWQGRAYMRPADLRNAALRVRPPVEQPATDADAAILAAAAEGRTTAHV
jgi:hypothetical protein